MIPHSRPTIGPEEKKACLEVLDSLSIAQGERVASFERDFCDQVGRRYAVAVSSGTAALTLSLMALNLTRGDEVILPSYNCAALLHAVHAASASPVLVDIHLGDFNLSVSEVKKKIRKRTKAVIVPHLFGRPAAIEELIDFKVPVIEDGTQALGARVGKKPVGSFGVFSVFSFYATKMIATGEGGMVLTDAKHLADNLSDLRDYDKKETYRFRTNAKMTNLEAAMGIEQLKKLPLFIEKRRRIASQYSRAFKGLGFILPPGDEAHDHVYYRYVLRVSGGCKEFMGRLESKGIEVKQPVFNSLHRYMNLPDALFPATTQAMEEACSLPIFPSLSDEECESICQAIREIRPVELLIEKKAELVV